MHTCRGDGHHYLKMTRFFTAFRAILIIFPALVYSVSEGSILEVPGKVGSCFARARLAMFGAGFFSKHTTERGLLARVAAGFVVIMPAPS